MNHGSDILLQSFEKWLNTLGYAASTVYASVHYVSDFFFYLEPLGIARTEQITPGTVHHYHGYLQTRGNKRRPGSLSNNYIAGNIGALKRFSKYLQTTGKPFFEVPIKTKPDKGTTKTILAPGEIQALYKACGNDYLGTRDRAILSIYYGCGLRRGEGAALDVKDILLKESLVFVKSGKGYKERYVPMTGAVRDDLENYIFHAREKIQGFKNTETAVPEDWQGALFLSTRPKRMRGNALINRVQYLASTANINKAVGLHTLRHSIATHLLQSGMALEDISRFLGHGSLGPTQIYTHLAYE